MAHQQIIGRSFVEFPDGTVKPFGDLSESEVAELRKNIGERVSRTMTSYYSRHPEELEKAARE